MRESHALTERALGLYGAVGLWRPLRPEIGGGRGPPSRSRCDRRATRRAHLDEPRGERTYHNTDTPGRQGAHQGKGTSSVSRRPTKFMFLDDTFVALAYALNAVLESVAFW